MRAFYAVSLLLSTVLGSCPRIPMGQTRMAPRTPGDGGYGITIGLDPQLYIAGNMYTVTLSGYAPFRKFLLTVEKDGGAREEEEEAGRGRRGGDAHPEDTGHFVLAGASGVYSEDCINTVVEQAGDLKSSANAIWVAPLRRPAAPTAACIRIRAMVLVDEEHWYADDGSLTKRLCPFREEQATEQRECCACDESKYKMVFEGLWSNATHPKDFPFMLPLTHFSDVIGGTHHARFNFWGEGALATDGLKQLAEWGSPGSLRAELLANSRHLKTLVQAAGLWYPNVNGNTSATFRVDRSRHLLSIVSMLGPSPDWIVGVSGLDLCESDCSWAESKVIDLFPYDAGTDNGLSYMSPNIPTVPREPIKKITSFYPEDPRAPFYDPAGREMRPLARLYVERIKVIPKSCGEKTEDELLREVTLLADNNEDSDRRECEVTDYTEWSECSAACGKGLRSRTRHYVAEGAARAAACDRQLVSKEMCVSANKRCPGDEREEEAEAEDWQEAEEEACRAKPWSRWSECSATCGVGIKMRTRTFESRLGRKRCRHVNTVEKEKCMRPPCADADTAPNQVDPLCPLAPWSDWSPCSATCGPGVSVRTRALLADDDGLRERCRGRVRLTQQFACHQEDCLFDLEMAKQVCVLPEEHGPCTGAFERWRYEANKGMCVPFFYGGCRGNRNNFATDTECLSLCSVVRDMLGAGGVLATAGDGNATAAGSNVAQDCAVSGWSSWSECSVTCGRGIKSKSRTVLVEPRNGGVPCPTALVAKRRCHRRCAGVNEI